jgi:hypothetical protein
LEEKLMGVKYVNTEGFEANHEINVQMFKVAMLKILVDPDIATRAVGNGHECSPFCWDMDERKYLAARKPAKANLPSYLTPTYGFIDKSRFLLNSCLHASPHI